jgi:NAD(P)-dependent dehydrogenase (short-subunit alcohol dehydrogenase family)
MTSKPNPNKWCLPQHHSPSGPTDPANVHLPSPFRVAILGASRGIGAGIALSYAKAGASLLILASRNQESLEALAARVRATATNPDCTVVVQTCDVTREADLTALADAAKSKGSGALDVVVFNAGISGNLIRRPETGLLDFPFGIVEAGADDFRRIMETNVLAAWNAAVHFLPLLEAAQDSSGGTSPQAFVLVSSAAAHYVDAGLMAAAYSLSKFAATRLVEHVHEGHGRNGVLAYAVQPGGVRTDMAATVPEGKGWEALLVDDVELCGAFAVWLTKERREWLSGRYVDARWDTEELGRRKERVVQEDLLKFRLAM